MKKRTLFILKVLVFLIIAAVIISQVVSLRLKDIYDNIYRFMYENSETRLIQATQRIIRDNGSPEVWAFDKNNVYNMYKKYLFYKNKCVEGKSGCFLKNKFWWNNTAYSTNLNSFLSDEKLILQNGEFIGISELYNDKQTDTGKIYSVITLNINTPEKFRKYGQDIFFFVLKNDGLHLLKCNDGVCSL